MKTSFTKERKAIENLYRKFEFDEIGNLPGIRVIERRDPELDFNRHYLCKHYIFGDTPIDWPTFSTSCDYMEVSDPEEGDIIFYFKENVAAHVGIYA
ncbi:MAG: hypothetical protein QMD85_02305, partial [Candidatus Aenigmarchaeota archaeon]|nr:hypothetical protein [Candidatus Aenigmarchaeota archaeon]MDI6722370.1 hypothetical protein [Candidatus Aenigmarchaeota archaeon]